MQHFPLPRPRARFLERAALWAVLLVGLWLASSPLRERFIAWQSQRALDVRWQQALEKHRSQPVAKPVSKVRHNFFLPKHSSARLGKTFSQPKKKPADDIPPLADASDLPDNSILWPLVRLRCPKIKLDAVVVEGTDAAQLKQGPGHDPTTSPPGGLNCVIAAHRNAYGWWFYHLHDLRPDDTMELQTPDRNYFYRVKTTRTVSVEDLSILDPPLEGAPRLTLYSCTLPKTEKRLVVVADLESDEPV